MRKMGLSLLFPKKRIGHSVFLPHQMSDGLTVNMSKYSEIYKTNKITPISAAHERSYVQMKDDSSDYSESTLGDYRNEYLSDPQQPNNLRQNVTQKTMERVLRRVDELENTLKKQQKTISNQQKTIDSQQAQISSLTCAVETMSVSKFEDYLNKSVAFQMRSLSSSIQTLISLNETQNEEVFQDQVFDGRRGSPEVRYIRNE